MPHETNEKIIFENPLHPLKIKRENSYETFTSAWHYHHELEMIAVIKGNYRVITKNENFDIKSGSVIMIGSYEPHHTYHPTGEIDFIIMQFDVFKYLGYELFNMRYFTEAGRIFTRINYILRENQDVNNQIFLYMNEILEEYLKKEKGYEIAIHSLVHRMILTLMRNDYKSVLNINTSTEYLRLLPALEYIENNTNEKINIDDVCSLVNMSYFHFGKCFKKVFGKTFRDYVIYKKILNAERLLLTSDLTILEIASSIGMKNMANFYKNFYSYNHCTPSEFRRKAHKKE